MGSCLDFDWNIRSCVVHAFYYPMGIPGEWYYQYIFLIVCYIFAIENDVL